MEHVRGVMVNDERAGMEESTRGGTSPDGCGGMVGWDCQLEIGTETGFGNEGLDLGRQRLRRLPVVSQS